MYMYISILWVRLSELGSNVTKLPPRVKGGVLCEAVAGSREPVASTPGPEPGGLYT